jgi:hypothetical protein
MRIPKKAEPAARANALRAWLILNVRQEMKLLLLSLCFVSSFSAISAAESRKDDSSVAVQAKLTELVPEWIWSPPADKNGGRPTFGGCRAKFAVMRPGKWAAREFWIDFTASPESLAKTGLSLKVGDAYTMILPGDFLAGKFVRIAVWDVREIKKEPNQPPEPTAPSGRGSP